MRHPANVPKVTILGIGNLLLQDEGVGVHAVQELANRNLGYLNLTIIDAGTSPEILALLDSDTDNLIIVDAVKGGDKPGTLYRFGLDDIDMDAASPISLHEMGVLENIRMMSLLDRKPKSTVIIGVEPKVIDYGLELSPEIQNKLPEMINLVLQEIDEVYDSPLESKVLHDMGTQYTTEVK